MPMSAVTCRRTTTPPWDIPLRMLLAAALVLAVTHAAGVVGAQMSGLLTPFPVAATILTASTHHVEGSAAAGQLLRALLIGLLSFAVFFLLVGAVIVQRGTGVAFATAAFGALAFHAALWRCLGSAEPSSMRCSDHSGAPA